MAFSKQVQEAALVASGRCCCLCHKFCGPKMELHHIIQRADGGDDSFENCIPLCLDCHADMGKRDAHHPMGKGYSSEELRMHRDNWYQRKNIAIANEITESDRKLFGEICAVFQQLMYTLTELDFSYGVIENKFESLFDLLNNDGNPFKEFLDGDLESSRVCLFNSASLFCHYFNYHMFLFQNKMVPHIYLMTIGKIDYDTEREKLFEEEVNKLNSMATELWKKYQEFVRTYRQKTK